MNDKKKPFYILSREKEEEKIRKAINLFGEHMKLRMFEKIGESFHGWDKLTDPANIEGRIVDKALNIAQLGGEDRKPTSTIDNANLSMFIWLADNGIEL